MQAEPFQFECRLAADAAEVRLAQRLRYTVFIEELDGSGAGVDHAARLETDSFDPICEHLLLIDHARPAEDRVVGVYRLLDSARMDPDQPFYSETEYDLEPLRASGRRLLELGRSCLHPDYRGGAGMLHLWSTLGALVQDRGIGILFGVASFHGTDLAEHAEALSQLRAAHLAPEGLRPVSRAYQSLDLVAPETIDRVRAMKAIPALIKAYLRLGGTIGDGAFVDHDFNTTDVMLVLDTDKISDRQRAIYGRSPGPAA